jgi:hypothetical protein
MRAQYYSSRALAVAAQLQHLNCSLCFLTSCVHLSPTFTHHHNGQWRNYKPRRT